MNKLGAVLVNVFVVSLLHLLKGSDYDYGSMQGLSRAELEYRIRSAASLEELLRIIQSRELKLWRCRTKIKNLASQDFRSASHRSTRFAAAFYGIDLLKEIDEEWQKTQCLPRETCVDVAKDLGTSTNMFFKPPCVSVFRCGGCCNEESLSCVNTSTSYISKALFEILVPLTHAPVAVSHRFANHTSCKCLPSILRHPYSIIRRSALFPGEDGCPRANKHCPIGWIWDSRRCECLAEREYPMNRRREELAICGAYMEFVEDSCECVCRRACPRNHVLNPENCTCECRETLDSCFHKEKIFHPDTCSCEDRCPFQTKTCLNGKMMCVSTKHSLCP
ncbi:vascular endothelial growth factor D isoform X2 [Rhinatrema bivittatum]|uniref:vascular endothelial growth factor D isoform X2 n=1 Tax=Rhinatrema bivittatum TaxID=194408 RepID=UPI00112D3DD3|nr:vascular endothelial growth factor D isoform X2 [Rhinatrema bivittatum]